MNNTKLIKTLTHLVKTESDDLPLLKRIVAEILTNKPTYKQLEQLSKIVNTHKWQVNVVDGDKKTAYNNGLKRIYYFLINDMMVDIAQGQEGRALDIYLEKYTLY
jgi:Lhr-like helicase